MFNSVITLTNAAKEDLKSFNKKLDEGEQAITDTNSNIRTDEIVNDIETLQNNINAIYSAITTINDNINTFENDINYSKQLRRQELAEGNTDEGDISIRDILGE